MGAHSGKRRVEQLMQTYGCLPQTGDGPIVLRFSPTALARAIEQEIRRAGQYGWSKITVHMDIPDAALLAEFLRRK